MESDKMANQAKACRGSNRQGVFHNSADKASLARTGRAKCAFCGRRIGASKGGRLRPHNRVG